MDDFTFPATAAAAESSSPADTLCLHHHSLLPFPHFANPPLWFPVDAAAAVAPTPTLMIPRRTDDMEEEDEEDDEEEEPAWADAEESRAGGEDREDVDGGRALEVVRGRVEGEEKMDMLWENFNEELDQALRRCSKQKAAESDTESDTERGCAPMPMLQASSRAGGTGRYYRRTSSWVLLMRIFRRLFVVEKTFSSASARHRQPNAAAR